MNNNRLFILDHQDPLMPYLRGINETSTKTYATRTILFLQDNGTLKPLAIELSLPHPDGDQAGSISTVHTPAGLQGAKATIWLLAKAYANVNDSVYHQLVCNWGLAVEDSSCRHGVRLLIEDYPFAVDGLEVWSAIKSWVKDYVFVYYKNDQEVHQDKEIQNWWDEVRTKGHGDKKHEPWWPKMQTRDELIQSCTIIIWVASALHAAVNFGQYAYGGYLPNRPATSRRLIPEPGTADYNELESQPEKAFLKTVTAQLQSILGISLIEILSRHSADEVFLGERDTPEWTTEKEALDAFDRFGADLRRIERKIEEMNLDVKLRNRTGPVQMPYTLLYPRHLI